MKNKYKIIYKIGRSEYEERPIDDVPKHWRNWYISLGLSWEKWMIFRNTKENDTNWVNNYIKLK